MMKSFETIVLKYMLPEVKHLFDPLQFAYRTKCSVEDATLSMLNVILERPGSYTRILFVDFSSAFNTIQPHLMVGKFIDLEVGIKFVMLVHSFLNNCTKYVKVNGHSLSVLCLHLRGVCCHHFCMPCTLILVEVFVQIAIVSNMQMTRLLSV